MASLRNSESETPGGSLTVRWRGEEFERITAAAEALSARQRIRITKTDIIRRGALREADAILEAAA